MKIDMKILRWVLLFLYICLVVGLLGIGYLKGWFFPSSMQSKSKLFWTVLVFSLTLISQAIFIFTAGTKDLCKPLRKRRVVLPIVIASFLMMILIVALGGALSELLYVDIEMYDNWIGTIIMGLIWFLWGLIFYARYSNISRFKWLKNLVNVMIAGSLIELLASIPSHLIVSKRPGCFVGIYTSLGISAGIAVMVWAFGPGVILLFLAEKRKAELRGK